MKKSVCKNCNNIRALIVSGLTLIIGCTSATTGTGKIAPRIYNQEYNVVFSRALEAAIVKKWQIVFADKETGIISAKTSTGFWTWGDNISIRIHKIGTGKVQVDLTSGTDRQVIDWGHNARNIRAFYKQLDSLINAL